MLRHWLYIASILLIGAGVLFLLSAGVVSLFRVGDIAVPLIQEKKHLLPESSFSQNKQNYDDVNGKLLTLKYVAPSMQLPDLKRLLIYYGPNGRPDLHKLTSAVYVGLTNLPGQAATAPGEKLYLLYDRKSQPPTYVFSPKNAETSLWIEVKPNDRQAMVNVFMKNEKGDIVQEPADNAQFPLEIREFVRQTPLGWEIGKIRVDGTLLARQKARWLGQDQFLLRHGGEEMAPLAKKQRVDFGEGNDAYTVYVGEDDVMVWNNNRWEVVEPGDKSLGKPLLVVSKVADRIITFDLWNPDGSSKTVLNLLKSLDKWTPQQIQQVIKFIGARTRSQYVFELDKSRMVLSPKDWIVKTEKGWKKLESAQDIDDYLDGKISGPMFVFDGLVTKEQKQYVTGAILSPSRTDMVPVEMDVTPSNVTVIKVPSGQPPAPEKPAETNDIDK